MCARVSRRSFDRKKERKKELGKRERPTAAKAGSLDIIEDDISDYPKDRNLSLSVLYFQLFYHSQSLWLSIHLENVLNCLLIGLERHLFNGDPSLMEIRPEHQHCVPRAYTCRTSPHPFMIAKRQTSWVLEANRDCQRATIGRVSHKRSDQRQNPRVFSVQPGQRSLPCVAVEVCTLTQH